MSNEIPYADIVILALVAGFILLRLRAVLGQKGDQPPPGAGMPRPSSSSSAHQAVVRALKEHVKEPAPAAAEDKDTALLEGLDDASKQALEAIRKQEPGFTLNAFLQGANGAFEMVWAAFAKGETDTLKMLLSPPLFQTFSAEIERRSTAAVKHENTLVRVLEQRVRSVQVVGAVARIEVHFESEQVSVGRDATGAIVEGDPTATQHVEDDWVFERTLAARNPNWTIVET